MIGGLGAGRFPDEISPGRAPGGVVVLTFRPDGELIGERRLNVGDPIERIAETDADNARPAITAGGVVLVGYDGDTGEMMTPPMLVDDDETATRCPHCGRPPGTDGQLCPMCRPSPRHRAMLHDDET